MTAARDTYNSSVQSALTNLNFAGAIGNTVAAPSFANNTQQFPSLAAIDVAYSLNQITAAQRVSYKLASEMNAQVQIKVAKDVLAASEGGLNPA
jgi:hypothetical protein